jgi:hypothetical protein
MIVLSPTFFSDDANGEASCSIRLAQSEAILCAVHRSGHPLVKPN